MIAHVRGVFLPDETERDAWIIDGRLSFDRPSGEYDTIASGGWVIPGLVDMHCHIGLSPHGQVPDPNGQADQALRSRETGALLLRDAGSPVDNRSVQARADLPRLIRAGRHIARPRRYIRDLGVEIEPGRLVTEVERQAAAGDGWVKLVGDWIDREAADLAPLWPADVLRAAVGRAHELGARVAVHVFGEDALPGLIAAGVDSIEHGTGLTDELVAAAKAAGCALVPTVVNMRYLPDIAASGEDRFPVWAAHLRALDATRHARVRAAWEAGIPLYVGTDSGGSLPHGIITEEIEAMASLGIPLAEVIAQASWNGRAWLGLPGLEDGAYADLVVYDQDPRTELGTLRAPRRIVLRGAVVA